MHAIRLNKHMLAIALGVSAPFASFGLALAATVQATVEVPSVAIFQEAIVDPDVNIFVSFDEDGNEEVTELVFEFVELQPPLDSDNGPQRVVYVRNDSDIDLRIIGPCGEFFDDDTGARIGHLEMFEDGGEGGACPWHEPWIIGPGEVTRGNVSANMDDETEVGFGTFNFATVFGAIGDQ